MRVSVRLSLPLPPGDDIASQLAGGGGERPSLSTPRLLAAVGLAEFAGDLTPAATAAMGDGEAAAAQRRLIASVMSLQPFLRDVGPSSAAAAAAAAAGAAPPLPQQELERERRSVAVLQAQCQALLGTTMPTSAAEDEALLASGEQLGVRRQAAVAARLEAKRLIRAAADALQRYADTLR